MTFLKLQKKCQKPIISLNRPKAQKPTKNHFENRAISKNRSYKGQNPKKNNCEIFKLRNVHNLNNN